jgi:hypothetical protein
MSRTHTVRLSLVVTIGLLAALATACGSSTSPSASPTTTSLTLATGGVTCTGMTGSLTFTPPLTNKGGSAESTAIALSSSGCTAKGSNVSTVTGGTASATISSTSNSCAELITSRALTINIAWAPATIRPSVLTFSGYGGTTAPSGGEGFKLPNPGGTAKVTGSFSGSDHGASSTAVALSNETTTQLLTACGSPAGLTSVQVTSGTVSLQ